MEVLSYKSKDEYEGIKYTTLDRFISYYYQVSEVLKLRPTNCLIIGQGDNIVPYILRSQGIEVSTFDIVDDMNHTYCGDILNIDKIVDKVFDVVLCCQVLEHLPFEKFDECLEKLSAVQKKGLIMSLPVFGISVYIKAWASSKINFIINFSLRFYKLGWKTISKYHYWEINDLHGNKLKNIIKTVNKHYHIENRFLVREMPYHMFLYYPLGLPVNLCVIFYKECFVVFK